VLIVFNFKKLVKSILIRVGINLLALFFFGLI